MLPSNCFSQLLDTVGRKVLYTTKGQPFLIAGSGTLGWDQVAANLVGEELNNLDIACDSIVLCLIEPGEKALVLNSGIIVWLLAMQGAEVEIYCYTGYFGDSFAEWCESLTFVSLAFKAT